MKWFLYCALILLSAQPLSAQGGVPATTGDNFFLRDRDRVVFYGDSITAQRYYTRYIEDFVLTRYPSLRLNFFNAGVPGDTVYGGYTGDEKHRLARDVVPLQPTVITVMLGMNDPGYVPFDAKIFDVFQTGYKALLSDMKADFPQARLTLISSSPYDEISHGTDFPGLSLTVQRYGQFVEQLARERGITVADFNAPVDAAVRAGLKDKSEFASLMIPDRIHPSEHAHWIMAEALLRAWHAPSEVSYVELDAKRATVSSSRNADISELEISGAGLRWTALEHALPLPFSLEDPLSVFVIRVGNLESMNQEVLRVRGLSAARYSLEIDGKPVADFSVQQLDAGVNLGLLHTPMLDQAGDLDWREERKMKMDSARFTLEDELTSSASSVEAVKTLRAAMESLTAEQHEKGQPKPHQFALIAK